MPAPRRRIRQNWPIGLYETKAKGNTYYRWRDPESGKFHGLGPDFEVARAVALQRNAAIAKAPVQKYLDKLGGNAPAITFKTACDTFIADLKNRKTGRGDDVRTRSDATIRDYESYCRRFCDHFEDDALIDQIDLRKISDYLDGFGEKHRARNMARGLLIQVWTLAKSKGWVKTNVPADTTKVAHAVKRNRLTIEQFDAVVHAAEPWFAAACRFALYCDQRRGDITTVLSADWKNGMLEFEAEKTGHVVRVKAGRKLTTAIEACLKSGPSNVKTIIRKPGRREPVSADMLTKAFAAIRDELISGAPARDGKPAVAPHPAWKAYKKKPEGKPTWHELRSLGAHLAERGGKDAKSLAGHATDQMAAMYQKGHRKVFEVESL